MTFISYLCEDELWFDKVGTEAYDKVYELIKYSY